MLRLKLVLESLQNFSKIISKSITLSLIINRANREKAAYQLWVSSISPFFRIKQVRFIEAI